MRSRWIVNPRIQNCCGHGLFRRTILAAAILIFGAIASRGAEPTGHGRLLFTSQGKTGLIRADGSALRYFDFQVHGQATWQPSFSFSDGRRIVFLSMEPRRDGPARPFDEYYTQTPTHIWV